MQKLIFKIDGKPIAKQSVKFTRAGVSYTPAHITNYSNWVKLCFKQAYPDFSASEFDNAPLKVVIFTAFEMPKSFSKNKQLQAIAGAIRPIVKPDCDNISKNILDSLNGLAYPDDKQIVSLNIEKFYSENAHTVVTISKCDLSKDEHGKR